jgi:hypothetical protein
MPWMSVANGKLASMDLEGVDLDFLLRLQRGVLSRAQALSSGLTAKALAYKIRPGGPWQKVLPGVYAAATGELTSEQRQAAAILYAGDGSLITGLTAVRFHRIRGPDARKVDVLVPAERKVASRGYVAVHRTRRMPTTWAVDYPRAVVLPGRAVADAVRGLSKLADARTVVASAVQQRRCTVDELEAELRDRRRAGDVLLRRVLAEVAGGIRSASEGDLRELIREAGLPGPLYNPDLYWRGKFLARPDAWWLEASVAVEVNSMEFHLLPEDYAATMTRQRQMSAAGINVVPVSPYQMRHTRREVMSDLAEAYHHGRPAHAWLTTRPAAA